MEQNSNANDGCGERWHCIQPPTLIIHNLTSSVKKVVGLGSV